MPPVGPKCLQLLGMHALSGCDTTSYLYGKGKIGALNTLLLPRFGRCAGHYTQISGRGNFVSSASRDINGVKLFTKKKKKPPKVMALPPTSANLLQHALRAHLQTMLWKAADHQGPPNESAHFGWEIRDDIPIPVIAQGDPAPPELINVIQCQCRARGKKCSTEACGCHKQHLSCTSCSGDESCCNPHTARDDAHAGWR